jgi:two-component system, sensor histidine kinase and response regulator
LIDITKIDTGYFTLDFRLCNIVKIVEDITLSVAEYVEAKGIELVFDTDVEELEIYCDFDALERILLNLLSNAFKFTDSGGYIYVYFKSSIDKVCISVKDTGVGISHENIESIFERFRQVENLMTRKHEGSGIGLSLVKHLVEMHGGNINIKSNLGEGSEFVVELPIKEFIDGDNNLDKKTNFQNSFAERINIEFSDIYF